MAGLYDWSRVKEAVGAGEWTTRNADLFEIGTTGGALVLIDDQELVMAVRVSVYQQHDYAEERREAVEKWGDHVASLIGDVQ